MVLCRTFYPLEPTLELGPNKVDTGLGESVPTSVNFVFLRVRL